VRRRQSDVSPDADAVSDRSGAIPGKRDRPGLQLRRPPSPTSRAGWLLVQVRSLLGHLRHPRRSVDPAIRARILVLSPDQPEREESHPNTWMALRVLLREHPRTSCRPAQRLQCHTFYLGRLMGAKTIYLEVFDRIDGRTLTGRLVRPATTHFLVQCPSKLPCTRDRSSSGRCCDSCDTRNPPDADGPRRGRVGRSTREA